MVGLKGTGTPGHDNIGGGSVSIPVVEVSVPEVEAVAEAYPPTTGAVSKGWKIAASISQLQSDSTNTNTNTGEVGISRVPRRTNLKLKRVDTLSKAVERFKASKNMDNSNSQEMDAK